MKIIAMSDLHGNLPEIPNGDLFLLGGDLLLDKYNGSWARKFPEAQRSYFNDKVDPWLTNSGIPTFGTWGNHDWLTFDINRKNYHIVTDKLMEFEGLQIWLSPWSPTFYQWNWMKDEDDLDEVYSTIPEGVDILVSHCPPYGYGDQVTPGRPHLGSKALLEAISRVKPRIVVCGHIHGGYGTYEMADGVKVYNVSMVDEGYRLTNGATVIDL